MAYGFSGTVSEFSMLAERGRFGARVSSTREASGGYPLSSAEERVWDEDATVLARLFVQCGIPKLRTHLLLNEYDIPGHLGRCDVVIVGADSRRAKQAAVFELKRWKRFEPADLPLYVRVGEELHLHPGEQAIQYRDLLSLFHPQGCEYDWHAGVWMTCMSREEVARLARNASSEAPVWGLREPSTELLDQLGSWFGGGLDATAVESFRDAPCSMDAKLAEAMFARLPNLTRGVSAALGGHPIDLSERQEEILFAINAAVQNRRRTLVLVYGAPGCGKTVVGISAMVHALLRQVEPGVSRIDCRSVLVLRNNRLCTVVRQAIDEALGKRVGKALVQYVKGGGPGVGIQPVVEKRWHQDLKHTPPFDLVVADEAHRIPHGTRIRPASPTQLEAVLSAGRVVACLVDDGQILNEDDNGARETVKATWRVLHPGDPIVELDLAEQHRVPESYAGWLEDLLHGTLRRIPTGYDFRVVETPQAVVDWLRDRLDKGDCGLLASYTVCNGRKGNDLRVPSPAIRWLMDPKEIDIWWRTKAVRHRLDRCASVYSCQGFELDYAGLFWGRDLVLRQVGSQVILDLHRPHDVRDDIQVAHGRRLVRMADEAQRSDNQELRQLVVSRLINRYRIFLSRGRKGTVVHCEDNVTADVLRQCQ